jgi:Helix-turn-helix domain
MTKILDDYLSETDLAEELGVTVRTLQGWRQRRIGPAWTRIGGKAVIYPRIGIPAWLKANEQQPIRERKSA